MQRNKRKDYIDALSSVIEKCTDDKRTSSQIRHIALLGSVREKEHVPGYSDLDVLFILKSDASGCMNKPSLLRLKKIAGDLSNRYPIKISFLTHTVCDLETYVDYEYLRHYSWGRVLYGDKKKFVNLFSRLLALKRPGAHELRQQAWLSIVHARFNLTRRYVSLNEHNTSDYRREMLHLFIDNVLEITDWRLIGDGIWCTSKKALVDNARRRFVRPFNALPGVAYAYRKNWNNLEIGQGELSRFLEQSLQFIDDCVRHAGE